jgi:hypothetical protein
MDVLRREILEKYNVELAAEQMRAQSAPPVWISDFLGSDQWRIVLKELIAKYPQCNLLTHAAREMASGGFVEEVTDLQTVARVPSLFLRLASNLIPRICGGGSGTSLVPAHVAREKDIQKLCSVAHQNEATLIYVIQLVTKLQQKRWMAESASWTKNANPSPTLLRLTHLLQRLRDFAWTEKEQRQDHHEETVDMSRALFRWSAKRDRSLNDPTDESVAAVDELRRHHAHALRLRSNRTRQSAKLSRIDPVTTIDFCSKYFSLIKATPVEKRSIFRDSVALEALLLDLMFPLAQLKTQHRSEIAGCISAAMALENGDQRKLQTLLVASSELCNNLPSLSMYQSNKPKFQNLLSTRIVARGLMVWIKESLSSPKLYDGQAYQR